MRRTPLKYILDCAIELFGSKEHAYSWWTSKNLDLCGKTPHQVAKEGKGYKAMRILYRLGLRVTRPANRQNRKNGDVIL